jgi:phage FluMu gp28-like protein
VQPIAPWIDIQVQERLRRRDLTAFCRESQCEPADEDAQFLSWQLIQEACHLDFQQDRGERWRKRQRDTEHVYTLGWDYARYNDFSVSQVLEHTPEGVIQVYERVLRGVDTPTQNRILDHLVDAFRPDIIRIDKTGVGLGLYDYAVDTHGGRVKGIDFASKMPTGRWERRQRVTAPTRDLYANNLRTLLQDHQLRLFNDPLLKQDLHIIPYELTTTRRTAEGSHGDRFWALALAAYPTQSYHPITVETAMRPEVAALRARRTRYWRY